MYAPLLKILAPRSAENLLARITLLLNHNVEAEAGIEPASTALQAAA